MSPLFSRGNAAPPCNLCAGPRHNVTYLFGPAGVAVQRVVALCTPCDGHRPPPAPVTNAFGQPTDGRGTQ